MKKKIFTIALVIAMAVPAVFAQSAISLVIGADPEAFAMAGASMSSPADAFAVENNAAMMSLSSKTMSAEATYGIWAPSSAHSAVVGVGGFYRIGEKFALGLSGKYFMDKTYDIINNEGIANGSYNPKDIVASLGVSYELIPGLSAGVAAKYITSDLGVSMKGSAVGADVMLAYSAKSLKAALGVANIGSKISYGADSYSLPACAKAGASYSIYGLLASVQAGYYFSGSLDASIGLEYNIADIAFLRAGYHYGDADGLTVPSYLSAGLGLKFKGVELNAAYLFGNEALGSTMSFGLGYSF